MQLPEEKYKWLLLPCLNKVREFDGKLLLAAVAAERGWGTVLGYKGFIQTDLFQVGGVIVEMSFKSTKLEWYASLNRKLCAWDEEGLVFADPDHYFRERLQLAALQRLDMLFLWGEYQRQVIRSHVHGLERKLHVTGNARFDMLRPELRAFHKPEVQRLQDQYGKFILINTNFAFVNNFMGARYDLGKLKEKGAITTAEQERELLGREAHEEAIMRAMMQMVPGLRSRFPEHTIIIRPHPSENFDTWRERAAGLPEVFVVHEGDVVAWLLAAAVSIHNGCTTGLQAYLLGRPVIAYRPVVSEMYDKPLPNSVSVNAYGLDELSALAGGMLSESYTPSPKQAREWRSIAGRHIESLSGRLASDRIMDALETLDVQPQTLKRRSSAAEAQSARSAGGPPASDIKDMSGSPEWIQRQEYLAQTFPPLELAAVEEALRRLQQVTGRFAGVRVYVTAEHTICVFPSED